MHRDEKWQVFAVNGEPVDGEWWDAGLGNPEVTGSDKIVGIAIVFLYRKNEAGELELLWQRRSDAVDRYPGDWDISAGGHINLGESRPAAAVREAYEEIGAKVRENELRMVTENAFNLNRFAWIYLVDWTGREEAFSFNDAEVSEVKWVKFSETREFMKKYAKAPLKDDAATVLALENWFKAHGDL